jgi:hypothetical protein
MSQERMRRKSSAKLPLLPESASEEQWWFPRLIAQKAGEECATGEE